MKNFIIYDGQGRILRTGHCSDDDLLRQVNASEFLIEGEADFSSQYIVDGAVVDLPPKPAGDYAFNYASRQWEFDDATAIKKALSRRDQLLRDGPDRISPIWWLSMTAEQQQAWAQYRQDLLDVPQQPGFPADIMWPIAPGAQEWH